MKRIVMVAATVLLFGALFVADAQVLPGVQPVVVDARGNLVGSVISTGQAGYPPWVSLQLGDGRFVAVPVNRNNFGQANFLFFFSSNCKGPAYIVLTSNTPPNQDLFAPAAVLPPGTNGDDSQLLYVATENATPIQASGYALFNGQCFPIGPEPFVPAFVAADLATQFRPPYSVKNGPGQ